MAAGKHIGKVLIKVREEETKLNSPHKIILKEAIPRFVGRCEQVHIICGKRNLIFSLFFSTRVYVSVSRPHTRHSLI